MIKNIIFDLDGTLINTEHHKFDVLYCRLIAEKFNFHGVDKKYAAKIIMDTLSSMENNDGSSSNKDKFLKCLIKNIHLDEETLTTELDKFYANEYNLLKQFVQKEDITIKAIKLLKEKGYNLIIATNPMFPRIGLLKRMEWGGLDKDDFSYITDYDNSSYCKPNPKYYEEIINKNNLNINETIMFGNDAIRDLAIESINIPCFIITNYLVNEGNIDSCKLKGDYNDFYKFISNLPNIN